jgi:hypothetical protein
VSITPSDIRRVVTDFLGLLEAEAPGAATSDCAPALRPGAEIERRLALVLDQLAFVQHFVEYEFDARDHPDPPRREYQEVRRSVERVFPDFGAYNVPAAILTDIGASVCGVGDAVDDVSDIAIELYEVEWRFAHTSPSDALLHFSRMYRVHWREHVRGLQLYLAAREDAAPQPD